MELAYRYKGRNREGKSVAGVLYSQSLDDAHFRLNNDLHYRVDSVSIDPVSSINNLINPNFAPRDLIRFYIYLGSALERGDTPTDALSAAVEFMSDEKLKQSISLSYNRVLEGSPLPDAMELGGFPKRDVEAIRATQTSPNAYGIYRLLANDIQREHDLSNAIKKTLYMPKIVLSLVYFGGFGALAYMLPSMSKFIRAMPKVQLDPMIQQLYAFADYVTANKESVGVMWVLSYVGVALFVHSTFFKSLFDHIRALKVMSQKMDHAMMWTSYAMLQSAGMSIPRTLDLVARASRRVDTAAGFREMRKLIDGGTPPARALDYSGFPEYIIKGAKSALNGKGDPAESLFRLAAGLHDDVQFAAEKLQNWITMAANMLLMGAIFAFFMVSMYPIISTIGSQLSH